MAALTVLTIGLPLSLAAKRAWERRGVFLTLAQSPGEAVPLLRRGDFDLCLLGRSVSNESRAKLASIIRETLRLAVPIVSVDDHTDRSDGLRNSAFPPAAAATLNGFIQEARRSCALSTEHFTYRFKRVL